MNDGQVKKEYTGIFLSWRRIAAVILIAAVAVRIELLRALLESPLRYFSSVPGLDMQTLLTKGEWGVTGGPMLTAHRLMVAAFWWFNGAAHRPEMIAAFQMFLGILTALMVGWCALHLTRKRGAALASGILAACYAPSLLYECVMLQEAVVTFTGFLSFFVFLWSRKRHFRGWYGVVCGAALGFAAIGRPTAIFWALGALGWIGCYVWRKRNGRRIFFALSGFLFLLAFTSWFNWNGCGYVGPFFRAEQYAVAVNTAAAPSDGTAAVVPPADSAFTRLMTTGFKAAARVPLLFSVREIPENINYYFLRDRVWPLSLLPGPALLVPFALAGVFLALLRWRRKEGIVLGYLCLLALPLCAIHPLGRYRLMLIPVFAILALYPFIRRMGVKPYYGNIVAVLLALALNWNQFGAVRRSTDHLSWALALEAPSGQATEESCQYFYEAFQLSGGKNQAAAVNLLSRLIGRNEFSLAEEIADQALHSGVENPDLIRYYLGLIRMGQGRSAEAESVFAGIAPERIAGLRMKYYFFYGETLRLQGKREAALAAYARALASPGAAGFVPYIEAARNKLVNAGN